MNKKTKKTKSLLTFPDSCPASFSFPSFVPITMTFWNNIMFLFAFMAFKCHYLCLGCPTTILYLLKSHTFFWYQFKRPFPRKVFWSHWIHKVPCYIQLKHLSHVFNNILYILKVYIYLCNFFCLIFPSLKRLDSRYYDYKNNLLFFITLFILLSIY